LAQKGILKALLISFPQLKVTYIPRKKAKNDFLSNIYLLQIVIILLDFMSGVVLITQTTGKFILMKMWVRVFRY
jgi:hypothetical protein